MEPAVGDTFLGSIVRHVGREFYEPKNGKVRVRQFIELENGMNLVEDVFKDFAEIEEIQQRNNNKKANTGEYKEAELIDIQPPKIIATPPTPKPKKQAKKTKKKSIEKQKERELAQVTDATAAKEEEGALKRKQAEEDERRRKEAEEAELARKKAEEEQARKKEIEEKERARLEVEEIAQRKRQQQQQAEQEEQDRIRRKKKEEQDERIRKSQEAMAKRKKEADARRAAERKAKELARKRREIRDAWKPKEMLVYPTSTSAAKSGDGTASSSIPEAKAKKETGGTTASEDAYGLWTYLPGHDPEDDFENWQPQTCVVHPPGKDPSPNELKKTNIPHGYWSYVDGTEPDEDDFEWTPSDTSEMIFYPPGVIPDKPIGVWTFNPADEKNTEWPPPSSTNFAQLDNNLTEKFEPKLVTVYPESTKPKRFSKPIGQWSFGENELPKSAAKWEPQNILVYPPSQEPAKPDESLPSGVWTYSEKSEPHEEGEFNPNHILVYPPGTKLSPYETRKGHGIWTYDPASSDQSWPPANAIIPPRLARVFPKDKVPSRTDKTIPQGVWCFGSDYDDDGDNWAPVDVELYEKGQEPDNLDKSSPHGVWGYSLEAEPDADGKFDPSDLWIFAPGENPPDDSEWQPQGCWTPPEKLKFDWPPTSDSLKKTTKAGKLPNQTSDSKPDAKAIGLWIFSSGEEGGIPDDESPFGVWKSENNDSVPDPSNVIMHKQGDEPDHINKLSPYGVWGYAPGAEPDEDGNFAPEDTWFFADGDEPTDSDEWLPQGIWTFGAGGDDIGETCENAANVDKTAKTKVKKKRASHRSQKYHNKAYVYPASKAPETNDMAAPVGVWMSNPASNKDGDDWYPQELFLHKLGEEPPETKDKKVPSGFWYYENGAEPDDSGFYKPKDMIFCPPHEPPPAGCKAEGSWSLPSGAQKEEFVQYRFEGSKMIYTKRTEITYMGTTVTFTKEWED